MIKIVIDSASDFTKEEAEKLGYEFAPLSIHLNENVYEDGVDIFGKDFFEKIENDSIFPKTSQVTVGTYEKIFRKIINQGNEVLCITLSSKISGCFQSAIIAKNNILDENSTLKGKIVVIDSLNGSAGENILIKRSKELVYKNFTLIKIKEILEQERKRICTIGVLDTLKYLEKGGRLSKSSLILGNLMKIKPVFTLKNGELSFLGKARGVKKAGNLLDEAIESAGGIDFNMPLFAVYTGKDSSLIEKYINATKYLYSDVIKFVEFNISGAVIGSHLGPNAVIFSFFGKNN